MQKQPCILVKQFTIQPCFNQIYIMLVREKTWIDFPCSFQAFLIIRKLMRYWIQIHSSSSSCSTFFFYFCIIAFNQHNNAKHIEGIAKRFLIYKSIFRVAYENNLCRKFTSRHFNNCLHKIQYNTTQQIFWVFEDFLPHAVNLI